MYQRVQLLGQGYFGEVWLEYDDALGRFCAAKYLHGPGWINPPLDPFAEARIMLQAEHNHVVQVFSAEMEDGTPVIRMEYLPDGSVADKHGDGPLPVIVATSIIEDACRGLEALHTRGLLHRDLKPANLMVSTNAVKVSDFGLACRSDQAAQAPIGYLPHLPPEVVPTTGYIETVAGDIYGMGVTLYRLLNGDGFLAAARAQATCADDLRELITSGTMPPRDAFEAHVHEGLRRVARRAMHQDAGRRFQSAAELRHAVEAARPRVSWIKLSQTTGLLRSGDVAWEGESVDGSSSWRAAVTASRGDAWSFKLERRLHGKSFRSLKPHGGRFTDRRSALSHAAAVLQRVAVEQP